MESDGNRLPRIDRMNSNVSSNLNPDRDKPPLLAGDVTPDYYGLLGLPRFESDTQLIHRAAMQRSNHLLQQSTCYDAPQLKKLLDELSAAKACLENPVSKAAYDTELLGRLAMQRALGRKPSPPTPSAIVPVASIPLRQSFTPLVESVPTCTSSLATDQNLPRRNTNRRRNSSVLYTIISSFFGGAIGLAAGYLILCKIDLRYDFLHIWKN